MTSPRTEEVVSPLSKAWRERHADECDYIIVSPVAVTCHARTVQEIVEDYIRQDRPYLKLDVYRKTTPAALLSPLARGPWIAVRGLNDISLRADIAEEFLKWFGVFSRNGDNLRMYERIDISAGVQAAYDERDRKAAEARQRELERKRASLIHHVTISVQSGSTSVEEIANDICLNFSTVENIVQELIAQGKLEIVEYQPPVQKLLRVKT